MARRTGPVLVALGVFVVAVAAQSPSLDWAFRAGGVDADNGRAVAVTASGETYVIGTFRFAATFGTGQPNETTLTSAGAVPGQDIFLAKYAASGTLLWVKGIGGVQPESGGDAGAELAGGVTVDAAGDVYVTGTLAAVTTAADFGAGLVPFQPGAFAARFDADGNPIWAASLNTSGFGWGLGIGTNGEVFAAGSSGEVGIGGSVPTIWKVAANGVLEWEEQAIGGWGAVHALAIGDTGTIRVAGRFAGAATFDAGQPSQVTLNSLNSSGDGFLASYDGAGTLIWAQPIQSSDGTWAEGVATDVDGNSYVTGAMHGSTTFGAGEPGETTLAAIAAGDGFISKFASSGTLVWARQIGATANAYGRAVAVDATGSPYVTGFFGGVVTFGAGELTATQFTAEGGSDVFLAMYETNGGFEWARRDGGAAIGAFLDSGNGLAVGALGDVYVIGEFVDAATFGAGETSETTLAAAGATDVFLARYGGSSVPPLLLDLDIAQFRVASRATVGKGTIEPVLVIRNNGPIDAPAVATVSGVQNGVVVYLHTLTVSDAPGGGRTTYRLPTFAPTAGGDIVWSASVADDDPDVDEVQAVTRVGGA